MYGGRDYDSAVNDMVEACERIIMVVHVGVEVATMSEMTYHQ